MKRLVLVLTAGLLAVGELALAGEFVPGREVAVPHHLAPGDDSRLSIAQLVAHGRLLFDATWTDQEGGGRPLAKGTGKPLSDPTEPLRFPRNFNRISAPDANSCGGCHNLPRLGGGGDIVSNVFVLGQRFDHVTFDPADTIPTHGSEDESGSVATLDRIANSRATIGMFGSGYIEMLAREMTEDLQRIRDGIPPGGQAPLRSKGVGFGTLRRTADGGWDTSAVEGLPASSLASSGAAQLPSLLLRPFHQAGAVVSLREFTNNAFNHHHGIQSAERFGNGDADGDGFADELTSADVTAAVLFQATLPPPGRVIPRRRAVEAAVRRGEELFGLVGCADCHVPELPLKRGGWVFTEPNPYNPPGNLQLQSGHATVRVDLNDPSLPGPRLRARSGVTMVPAFTDLKLHDITSGADDPDREALDMLQPPGSEPFFAGNGRFITRKLWGIANEPPFLHHGKCTTMRDAIVNHHHGEAQASNDRFVALAEYDQGAVIEFLKTLQVLPEGATSAVVDERFQPRGWPPQ